MKSKNRSSAFVFYAVSMLLTIVLYPHHAQAQSERVIYSFTLEPDGAGPSAGLIMDTAGNLYGTTSYGGAAGAECASGCGTVFKVDTFGAETVLYTFTGGADGADPNGLAMDSHGALYGTAFSGGDLTCNADGEGCGTVFKLDSAGNFSVIHTFTGNPDGKYPWSSMVMDPAGNLYGTTYEGGTFGCGTVYRLATSGTEKVLHSFVCGGGGYLPRGGLVRDSNGNLYGTTTGGGSYKDGIIFRLSSTGKFTVLHNFNGIGGSSPYAGLIGDSAGNGYGTTYNGGVYGFGTVFKLDSKANFTVLYSFKGTPDGASPQDELVLDAKSNLYGTTSYGGNGTCGAGCGVVFELDPSGSEAILHNFTGEPDGAFPWAALTMDAMGNLYGTSYYGGDSGNICNGGYGCGTVFEITP